MLQRSNEQNNDSFNTIRKETRKLIRLKPRVGYNATITNLKSELKKKNTRTSFKVIANIRKLLDKS